MSRTVHSASPFPVARYQRTARSFEDLMGAPAGDVLDSMDRAGDDVPNQRPVHALGLTGVGLRRRAVIVRIRDPFESSDEVPAVCTITVSAAVPATHRGIHASRIGHAIAETSIETYRDLPAYAETLARAVAESQYGRARVLVRAAIPYCEQVRGETAGRVKTSLEHLHLIVQHTMDGARGTTDVGLRVTHLIACPCVQKTYQHVDLVRGGEDPHEGAARRERLMTHSQRCETTVVAHDVTGRVSVLEMLTRLDAVLFRTCNTLPRDAELALVYRAHRAPQFIEDAVRAAVVAMAEAWRAPAAFRSISARGRSLESIHAYDLTAALQINAAELMALEKPQQT
jgi:GTP cyclohydrolase FolE2